MVSQPIYLPPVGFFRPATHTQHTGTEAHTHRRLCTHPTETLVYSISIDRLRFSLSDASQIRNKYDKKQTKIKLERNYQLARDGRRVTRSIFRLLFGGWIWFSFSLSLSGRVKSLLVICKRNNKLALHLVRKTVGRIFLRSCGGEPVTGFVSGRRLRMGPCVCPVLLLLC